jgi:hypothetical protein
MFGFMTFYWLNVRLVETDQGWVVQNSANTILALSQPATNFNGVCRRQVLRLKMANVLSDIHPTTLAGVISTYL